MKPDIKIGTGYDVHRLAEGRLLWLGGVQIPFNKGCLAHSDGDVLLHAIIDALMGALAMGDIGTRFPDTDPAYKNISSIVLLQKTRELVKQRGFVVGNIDSVIVLQQPKVSSFISEMRSVIAKTLETSTDNISVKATTTEGLGITGTGEGIAAYAVVLLVAG
jgi:2-C-methyl-D-erythritol 2,4-cyclodiphosphate synthase